MGGESQVERVATSCRFRAAARGSIMKSCGRPCWIQTVIIFFGLGVLVWWSFQDPLIPTPDDCQARGQAEDCWEYYDINGRPIP